MQSVVCSLRSAASSLQSANVTHRKKKQGVWRLAAWLGFFCQKLGDRGHFVRTQCMDVLLSEGDWSLLLEAAFMLCYWLLVQLASVLIESAEILLLKVRKGF